jgi:hypothetical protein
MCAQSDAVGFTEALAGFIQPENIITDTQILEEYIYDCGLASGVRPWLAVCPQNKVQIKNLVKLANDFKMPLVPLSSGPPHLHGGAAHEQGGIMVDFRKMDRIFKIDALNRCVRVEPGVTFTQLIPALSQQGLRLNMPLLPRANKSVLAAYLEREPLLIPKYQYDNIDPLLTTEVIFGTGDEFRTGSASGPGDLEHLNSDMVNPWGPSSLDYLRFISGAQGTMGLVTWANIKVEVLPLMQELYFISAAKVDELMSLVADLLRKRVPDECLVLNNVSLAAVLAENQTARAELTSRLPLWTVLVGLAGYQRRPEERLAVQRKQLMSVCQDHQMVAVSRLIEAAGRDARLPELLRSAWNREPYWRQPSGSPAAEIFFLSPLSRAAEFIALMAQFSAVQDWPMAETGCYIQPMVQGRGCHIEFNLPGDPTQKCPAWGFRSAAADALIRHGAFFSRPYGEWADMVYTRDGESTAALRKLKNVFDPNNILNPGKLCF